MALALLAYYWTPWVLVWAIFALIPVAFLLLMALAWWGAQTDVVERPQAASAGAAVNDAEPKKAASAA